LATAPGVEPTLQAACLLAVEGESNIVLTKKAIPDLDRSVVSRAGDIDASVNRIKLEHKKRTTRQTLHHSSSSTPKRPFETPTAFCPFLVSGKRQIEQEMYQRIG